MTFKHYTFDEVIQSREDNWPESASPYDSLRVLLGSCVSTLLALDQVYCDRQELSASEFAVLAALRTAAPPHRMRPGELNRVNLISPGGLTKILRRLEERGLIEREESPDDGRSRPVRLLPAGRAVAEEVHRGFREVDSALEANGFLPNDARRLVRELRGLANAADATLVRPRVRGRRGA